MPATRPAYGFDEGIGIIQETGYGVATVPDVFIRTGPNSLNRRDPAIKLRQSSGSVSGWKYDAADPRHYKGTPDVSGSIEMEMEYDDIGWWLSNAFKDDAPTGPADTTAYTHVFTLDATHPAAMPTSLTIARILGLAAEDRQYTGCRVNNLEIAVEGEAGAPGTMTVEVVGHGGGDAAVDDTIGGLSDEPFVEFSEWEFAVGAVNAGTGSVVAERGSGNEPGSMSFRLENNLRIAPAVGHQVDGANSRGVREPIYEGERRAIYTVSRDFVDDNFIDQYYNSSGPSLYSSLHFKATSPTTITGAATTKYSLDIYSPCVIITSPMPEYGGGADVIPEEITFEAADYDNSAALVTVTLVNATSTY